jgi:hypothetical protein
MMSSFNKLDLQQITALLKTSTPVQIGVAVASVSVALASWYLAPYATLAISVAKGWAISFVCGTPERRLLRHVKANAQKGNPQSVLDVIDDWCWSSQWMMNVGNRKGQILDEAVLAAKPMVRQKEARLDDELSARWASCHSVGCHLESKSTKRFLT